MARRPAVSIVGCGRMGGAIGLALGRAGYTVAAVWSRSPRGRRRAAELLGAPVTRTPAAAAAAGDVTFVCVPDDAIGEVARLVAAGVRPGRHVVHTSGGMSVDVLGPVRDAGGRIASLHPLQTVPDPQTGARALRGAPVAVTCEPGDRALMRRLASAWGGRPFDLRDEDKPRYHAAAVFASNYVVAAIWAAQRLMGGPHELLLPLVGTTVGNVTAVGPRRALTGPAVRGDAGTIRRHMAAIGEPPVRDAYKSMANLVSWLAR